MNALESRKQLLVAESELNRAQLLQEWQTMADEFHVLTRQAKIIVSLAAAGGLLAAGIASFRHKKSAPVDEKPSRWQTILKYAGVASSLWSAFRSRNHGHHDE